MVKNISCLGFIILTSSNQHEEIFYVKVQEKMTRFDALFDMGSQSNLIEENIMEDIGLYIHPHPHPYAGISGNGEMQVTKQCRLKFAMNKDFIDEVFVNSIPHAIHGIILGIPYLFDRKEIF